MNEKCLLCDTSGEFYDTPIAAEEIEKVSPEKQEQLLQEMKYTAGYYCKQHAKMVLSHWEKVYANFLVRLHSYCIS